MNRNVRKPKSSRDVYWAKLTSNWLPRWYHQLAAVASLRVRNPRNRSSSETFFARKICSWTELFMNRGVREPRPHCNMFAVMSTEVSVRRSAKSALLCDAVIKTKKHETMSYCLKIVPTICTMWWFQEIPIKSDNIPTCFGGSHPLS
jgi:hypothetical protein